jgi:hypothetical protein
VAKEIQTNLNRIEKIFAESPLDCETVVPQELERFLTDLAKDPFAPKKSIDSSKTYLTFNFDKKRNLFDSVVRDFGDALDFAQKASLNT